MRSVQSIKDEIQSLREKQMDCEQIVRDPEHFAPDMVQMAERSIANYEFAITHLEWVLEEDSE